MKDKRPSWAEMWLNVAGVVAQRATCPRLSVGVCLVSPQNTLISSGYNGAPSGMPHCIDVGCQMEGGHCIRVLHAEENALLLAARHGISTEGATCYAMYLPCYRCTIRIIQAGIAAVHYQGTYGNAPFTEEQTALYTTSGVGLYQHTGGDVVRVL